MITWATLRLRSWSNRQFGLLNLFVVYLIGGSTFLAIRVAVGPGSGFPALWMAASRFTVAGAVVLLAIALSKRSIAVTRGELLVLLASGGSVMGGRERTSLNRVQDGRRGLRCDRFRCRASLCTRSGIAARSSTPENCEPRFYRAWNGRRRLAGAASRERQWIDRQRDPSGVALGPTIVRSRRRSSSQSSDPSQPICDRRLADARRCAVAVGRCVLVERWFSASHLFGVGGVGISSRDRVHCWLHVVRRCVTTPSSAIIHVARLDQSARGDNPRCHMVERARNAFSSCGKHPDHSWCVHPGSLELESCAASNRRYRKAAIASGVTHRFITRRQSGLQE